MEIKGEGGEGMEGMNGGKMIVIDEKEWRSRVKEKEWRNGDQG